MKFRKTFAYRERLKELDDSLLEYKKIIDNTVANKDDDEYVDNVCFYIALKIAREELVEFGNEDLSEAAFDQFRLTRYRFRDIWEELYFRGYEKPAFIDFKRQLSGKIKADKLYKRFKAKNIEVTKVDDTKYLEDKKKPQPKHLYMKDTSLYTEKIEDLDTYEFDKKGEVESCLEKNRESSAANAAAKYYAFRRVKEEMLTIYYDEFGLPGVDLVCKTAQLANKYYNEVKNLKEFKKIVEDNIKQGKFDFKSFYVSCKSLENKTIPVDTDDSNTFSELEDDEQESEVFSEEGSREDEEAEDKANETISADADDNSIVNEKPKDEAEEEEAEVNEEDEVFDASEWVIVDKPYKDPKYSTRGEFDTVYQKLKQARNFTSSGQYDELLTMVKKMNESDDFKGSEVLDDEQKCVIRLLAIKSRINTYLKHKAVDGVKQNSYKKLAAVEELNELVSNRLSKMDFKEFNFNGENISKNSLNITYEQESEAYYNKESVRAKENAPIVWKDKEYRVKLWGAINRYPNVTLQEIRNVDRCMCRIILGALANDNVPVERINELKEQRTTFRENPGVKIVTEAVDNPARRM